MNMLTISVLLTFFLGLAVCEDDHNMALKFLSDYGYLSAPKSSNQDLTTALRNFQAFYGLKESGVLDSSTVSLMKKPRCSVPDPGQRELGKRYSTGVPWRIRDLTYYVQPGVDLPADEQRQIFHKAFQMWADVSSLTFSEVSSPSDANIKISFGIGKHSGTSVEKPCYSAFDGRGNVLAHAFQPEDGRIHFDEDETWTSNIGSGVNLLAIALHEIGHVLGAEHTGVNAAVMHPFAKGGKNAVTKLHSDDIAGIRNLYGSKEAPLPTRVATGEGCADKESIQLCNLYKEHDYCTDKYREVMEEVCPKTCYNCKVGKKADN